MWNPVRALLQCGPVARTGGERVLSTLVIPGTSEAVREGGGFRYGGENYPWIQEEFLHRTDLRNWDALANRKGFPAKEGESTSLSICLKSAQDLLSPSRFSETATLCGVFGPFRDMITMFLIKNDDVDHPILHFTNAVLRSRTVGNAEENAHPILKSMTILLVSEMYGIADVLSSAPKELQRAINDKHDLVAKIGEIAWITHELHRKVVDASVLTSRFHSLYSTASEAEKASRVQDWHRANKTAALIGDLLLTQKCAHLAALKSPIALELLCNSLAHFCESEFELRSSGQNQAYSYESYLNRTELGLGSLLGHCLYSALLFSGFNDQVRREAFQLGSRLGILLQTYDDIKFFASRDTLENPSWLDVGLLPIILHMRTRPNLLHLPHPLIFQAVKENHAVMSNSVQIFNQIQESVLEHLYVIKRVQSPLARKTLVQFIESLSPGV